MFVISFSLESMISRIQSLLPNESRGGGFRVKLTQYFSQGKIQLTNDCSTSMIWLASLIYKRKRERSHTSSPTSLALAALSERSKTQTFDWRLSSTQKGSEQSFREYGKQYRKSEIRSVTQVKVQDCSYVSEWGKIL